MNTKRALRFTRDPDGTRIARIPLANRQGIAEMHVSDLDTLEAAGLSLNFYLNSNGRSLSYVRTHERGGNTVNVARFLAGACRGQVVEYADGNRLNLRRPNLLLTAGPARMDCRPAAR